MGERVPARAQPKGWNGPKKANFKHGLYSAEMIAKRRFIRELFKDSRQTFGQIEKSMEGAMACSLFVELYP